MGPKGPEMAQMCAKKANFLECRGCAPERRVVKQAVVNPCPKPGWSSNYISTTLGGTAQKVLLIRLQMVSGGE